jgi:DNA (cytosine-5)-methyltransferase 1
MPDGWTLIPTPRRNFRLDETGMLAYLAAQAGLDPKDDPDEITRLAADGPRYKAIGNSMAVPVMRWIGERLHHSSASTPGGGVAA